MIGRALKSAGLAILVLVIAAPLATVQATSKLRYDPSYAFHHMKPVPKHLGFGQRRMLVPQVTRPPALRDQTVVPKPLHKHAIPRPLVGPRIVDHHKLARPVTRHNLHRRQADLRSHRLANIHRFKAHPLTSHRYGVQHFRGHRFSRR